MTIYTKIISEVLFPLHEKLKDHSTLRIFREMERTQWLPSESIRALQLQRLKDFLSRIGEHVPYYRQLFSRVGLEPGSLETLEDLQILPLTGKSGIRSNAEQMKSEVAQGLSRFSTSGSSGQPLVFFLGKKRVSHDVAAKRRATRWWGVDIGDPEIVVWGSPVELDAQDIVRTIRDRMFRTKLLSTHDLSPTALDDFVSAIKTKRPKMLFGYPSALARIGTHLESRGESCADLGIKVAFVTAEQMLDHQRLVIEKQFGCPTANGYGGRDAGFIAHQCPQGGMHITAEDIIVEIVDQNGRVLPVGETGEIVVTHLASEDFPFVRYPTGDRGSLSSEICPCGRGLPLLREVQGRTNDLVIAMDGRALHQTTLNHIMRDIPGINAFKVIQYALDRVTLQLVTSTDYDSACEDVIKAVYRDSLGQAVNIVIEYCTEIAPEKSGKHRYVVSHVTGAGI